MKIEMTGQLSPCKICAQAKIRQSNIPKKKLNQVPIRPGYRTFIDISSFQHENMGDRRPWMIAVDEFSDCSDIFLKRKSYQTIVIPIWIKGLNNKYGMDNSGENRILQKECDIQNLGVIFEFTAPGTP